MKIRESEITKSIQLWDDLGFYIWMHNWRKADEICKKLNALKKEKPFKYYISLILSKLVSVSDFKNEENLKED